MNAQPRVFAWSLSGELLESALFSSFAAAHELGARYLFTRQLLVQVVVGREPDPLVLATGTGDVMAGAFFSRIITRPP